MSAAQDLARVRKHVEATDKAAERIEDKAAVREQFAAEVAELKMALRQTIQSPGRQLELSEPHLQDADTGEVLEPSTLLERIRAAEANLRAAEARHGAATEEWKAAKKFHKGLARQLHQLICDPRAVVELPWEAGEGEPD